MKQISQREAHQLRRRVAELEAAEEQRRNAWTREWPGGTHLTDIRMAEGQSAVREVFTARKLHHAVIVVPMVDTNQLRLIALPLSKVRS